MRSNINRENSNETTGYDDDISSKPLRETGFGFEGSMLIASPLSIIMKCPTDRTSFGQRRVILMNAAHDSSLHTLTKQTEQLDRVNHRNLLLGYLFCSRGSDRFHRG